MEVTEIMSIISNVGFPIAVAVFLMYDLIHGRREQTKIFGELVTAIRELQVIINQKSKGG